MTATLADLPFLYLYIRLKASDTPLYRSRVKRQGLLMRPVPEEFLPVVQKLGAEIASNGKSDLILFDNLLCRFSRQQMADGEEWICVRRVDTATPELNKLGFAPHIYNHLHSLGQRTGLILLSSMPAHGKTMTAASLLADFLKSYGGLAVTIESPVEYNLKGRHGENGQCFQIQPATDEDWAKRLKEALAWSPQYIFAGDVRTPQVAEILLRAATAGHTVLTTIEAATPEDALIGLLYQAEQVMGAAAKNILAQGLTALLFQTMKEEGPFIRYLFTEENAQGDPVRTLVREDKVTMISTYVDRIAARLSAKPAVPPSLPPLPRKPPAT